MELWIRSQDKQQLVKVDNLYLKEITFEKNDSIWKEIYCNNDICIGLYLKERALEVLDEIEEKIMLLNTFEMSGGIDNEKSKRLISVFGEERLKGLMFPYEMPLE